MPEEPDRTVYTGEGIRAVLAPEGEACLFEVTLDGEPAAGCSAVDVEVLLQPRADNGLPCGSVQRLYSTSIAVRRLREHAPARGFCWLPSSLPAGLLRSCYFRVRPAKMSGEQAA